VDFHVPEAGDQVFSTSIEHSRAIPVSIIGLLYLEDSVAADGHSHIGF
jgi:hypothetical protein